MTNYRPQQALEEREEELREEAFEAFMDSPNDETQKELIDAIEAYRAAWETLNG